jgi:hypothetical protein
MATSRLHVDEENIAKADDGMYRLAQLPKFAT